MDEGERYTNSGAIWLVAVCVEDPALDSTKHLLHNRYSVNHQLPEQILQPTITPLFILKGYIENQSKACALSPLPVSDWRRFWYKQLLLDILAPHSHH